MSSGPLDVVASLYQLAPEDFVAARARAAADLKAEGDEVGAARVRKLPKPTVAASWVNRVARRWPEELDDLLRVGADLRGATTARDRAELARLDRARRLKTDALMSLLWHHGGEQAGDGARAPSNETLTRVLETLTAAVMDPAVADQVRAGTLARTVVHEGFTLLDADADEDEADAEAGQSGSGGPRDRRGPTITLLPAAVPPERPMTHPSLHGREDRAAVQRATADLVDAENDLGAARDTVESLVRMLEVLESELATMTRDRDSTRTNVASWRRKLRDAERHARVARSRLEILTGGDDTPR
ncbi:hypothetical protein [Serinibacter arcticus]|uniref:Uncharacterized protein n=1 Tax=Serinibacter arcticus TaxID=1655435 RepID=A0A4Z1E3N0_9MICO|nr:hypothetical protein [Serinibacter arcticus]TGO04261.1 hypothetical protein SERN_1854 [Serinibacter arcticus]